MAGRHLYRWAWCRIAKDAQAGAGTPETPDKDTIGAFPERCLAKQCAAKEGRGGISKRPVAVTSEGSARSSDGKIEQPLQTYRPTACTASGNGGSR